MIRRILVGAFVLVLLAVGVLALLGSGVFGRRYPVPEPAPEPLPTAAVEARASAQDRAARTAGVSDPKQILFGDLHVHTTYSTDAFLMSLPMAGGEGAHPVADACDFARFCAGLDFWSVNDHALALTPRSWRETVETIRQCNARAGDPEAPDLVSFLGWEWTQIGDSPENHYGHKNVVLRHTDDARIPARPIAAGTPPGAGLGADGTGARPSLFLLGMVPVVEPSQQGLDMARYLREMTSPPECPGDVPVRELPPDCRERAATPADLFGKLDDWGHEALVIPHGTTWGYYTPLGSSWDKQLQGAMHDPERQTLIEVFSGHGNAEEYRSWREVEERPDGSRACPEPTPDYLPSCWRAGEIIAERCAAAGEDAATCAARAAEARQLYVDGDQVGHLAVPGATPADWLDAGQCRDCFQPAFNHRPRSSVQYIMALRRPGEGGELRRFELGFLASSDNHSARPGTGYKEFARTAMTEARFWRMGGPLAGSVEQEVAAQARPFDVDAYPGQFFALRETERQASFFLTGGLVATHAAGRDRDAIWEALDRREVYGTSGPRILLWFDLENPPQGAVPMGGEAALGEAPRFVVRAVGSLEQAEGCPPASTQGLTPERLASLCRGECHHPTDTRRPITRIEVVRILPQVNADESVDGLVQDPWKVLPCDGDPAGCTARFDDPTFAAEGRDALYYVRAIEAPSLAVNAGGLRCERDAEGRCVEMRPCLRVDGDDDCLAETEERAWSSPIFVRHLSAAAAAALPRGAPSSARP